MTTVMVTAAGRRVYVVEALLAAAGGGDRLLVTDRSTAAPALAVPGASVIAPPAMGQPYAEWLVDTCRRCSVDALLSLHDYEAVEIARIAPRLEEVGARFIGPNLAAAVTLIDKVALAQHLQQVAPDLAVPTVPLADVVNAPQRAELPLVVKDRFGSGSSGLAVVASRDELASASAAGRQIEAWHPTRGTAPAELVVQPLIRGTEYNVDIFIDWEGTVRGHSVKRKQAMRAGETDAAHVVVMGDEQLVEAASRALTGLTVAGNVDIDIISTGTGLAVLDVNPRFGGGYAFSALAGYAAAEGIWELSRGEAVATYYRPQRAMTAAKYVAVREIATAAMMS